MSVRPDLLGPEYLKQLQLLQDQVPPFSSADALRMVEAALPPTQTAKDVFMCVPSYYPPITTYKYTQDHDEDMRIITTHNDEVA
jgi:hypothetical protein